MGGEAFVDLAGDVDDGLPPAMVEGRSSFMAADSVEIRTTPRASKSHRPKCSKSLSVTETRTVGRSGPSSSSSMASSSSTSSILSALAETSREPRGNEREVGHRESR